MKNLKKFNELFGFGEKGVFKIGDRVKVKDQTGDWVIDKFLGKKNGFEQYVVRDPSGSGKTLTIYGNQIVR
jgi:hypothetical protein